jgi:hypothetical protein
LALLRDLRAVNGVERVARGRWPECGPETQCDAAATEHRQDVGQQLVEHADARIPAVHVSDDHPAAPRRDRGTARSPRELTELAIDRHVQGHPRHARLGMGLDLLEEKAAVDASIARVAEVVRKRPDRAAECLDHRRVERPLRPHDAEVHHQVRPVIELRDRGELLELCVQPAEQAATDARVDLDQGAVAYQHAPARAVQRNDSSRVEATSRALRREDAVRDVAKPT